MFKLDPKKKYYLFKQNPRFCAAPWTMLYLYPDGTVTTCVAGSNIMGNLNTDTLPSIIANHKRTAIKKDILASRLNPNCVKCDQLSNQGNDQGPYNFIRDHYNLVCRDLDVDYHDTNEFVLGALDLHWSSICDLKCVTCWAKQSSSLAKEQGLPVLHLAKDKAYQFIDWIVDNQHTLREIYLSGGEPMLIDYNKRLLARIRKNNDIKIRINSNLMWKQDNAVLAEVLQFPQVLFTCSADATHDKFNYIRRDANWDTFVSNLLFLKNKPNVSIRINMVFFVLSASSLIDTIDYFHKNLGVSDITINQCEMNQLHLRCRNLPDHIKQHCRSTFQEAISRYANNLNLVGQLRNCLAELDFPAELSYADYFNKIDQLSGREWRSIFNGH